MAKKSTDDMTLEELFELVAADLTELNQAVRRAHVLGGQQARRGSRGRHGQIEVTGHTPAQAAGRGLSMAITSQEVDDLASDLAQLRRQVNRVGRLRRSRVEQQAREQLLSHHDRLRKLIEGLQTKRARRKRSG